MVSRPPGNPNMRHSYGEFGLQHHTYLLSQFYLQRFGAFDVQCNIRPHSVCCAFVYPRIERFRISHY